MPDHSAKILETRNKPKVYIFHLVAFVFDCTMASLWASFKAMTVLNKTYLKQHDKT